jgi:hypothetical protein
MIILDKIEHFLEKARWYRTVVAAVIIALIIVHVIGCNG